WCQGPQAETRFLSERPLLPPRLPHPPHGPRRDDHGYGRRTERDGEVGGHGELVEAEQDVAEQVELVAHGVHVAEGLDPAWELDDPAATDGEDAEAPELLAQVLRDLEEAHPADDAAEREYRAREEV